jgi:membrane protease YdiL (CAAX protease family)
VVKRSTSAPSPLSPTHWPPDAFAWPRSLAALVAVGAAFLLGQLCSLAVATHVGVTKQDVQSNHLTWGFLAAQIAAYVPIVVALLLVLPWLARRSLAELGLRVPGGRAIGIALLGAVAMEVVTEATALVQYGITHAKPQEAATSLFSSSHDHALIGGFSILAVAIAPFVEELAFRGFVFNALLRYCSPLVAAVLSGLLFGLSHGSLTALIPLAASGVVLAYVYYRSGSLAASMLTHAAFNLVNVALLSVGID